MWTVLTPREIDPLAYFEYVLVVNNKWTRKPWQFGWNYSWKNITENE